MACKMGPMDEVKDKGHDGITHLFGLAGINMDEAGAKVGGKCRVNSVIGKG